MAQSLEQEQIEINLWARQALTTYFSWYTVFLTFNGAVLGLSVAYELKQEALILCVCGAFLIWNAFGIAAAGYTAQMIREANERIVFINQFLKEQSDQDSRFLPHSPIPVQLLRRALFLTLVSMCVLLIVWIINTAYFAHKLGVI
jgi:hypothetical protein